MCTERAQLDEILESVEIPIAFEESLTRLLAEPAILQELITDEHLIANKDDGSVSLRFKCPYTNSEGDEQVGVVTVSCSTTSGADGRRGGINTLLRQMVDVEGASAAAVRA